MKLSFHHIGHAVRDIEAATTTLRALGYRTIDELPDTYDETQNISIRFLTIKSDGPTIELICGKMVSEIIEKNGPMPYHLCYTTKNLSESSRVLRKNNYRPVTSTIKAKAFNNKSIQLQNRNRSNGWLWGKRLSRISNSH